MQDHLQNKIVFHNPSLQMSSQKLEQMGLLQKNIETSLHARHVGKSPHHLHLIQELEHNNTMI